MKRAFTKISKTTEVASTEYKLDTFVWQIGDFSQRTSPIESAKFDGAIYGAKWNLILYPDGYRTKNNGHLSLFVRLCTARTSKVHASFVIRIVNNSSSERSRIMARNLPYTFGLTSGHSLGSGRVIQRSTVLDPLMGFLVDDKLVVTCDLTMVVFEPLMEGKGVLTKQMKLLASSEYSDCVLICSDGVEIPACKFLLAAQSAVFRVMFKGDTEEGKTGRVNASDCGSETMRELLRFTCGGRVQNLNEIAAELLVVADKYDIDDLKQLCAESLANSLTEENVCWRLILADRHGVLCVKEAAFKLISEHIGHIKHLPNAKELFSGCHSDLLIELFTFMKQN
uniref:Speckle-type POZ protein n=1 Tax=Plectus sambesii TaxID=2011161 RepID=A0A914WDN3_9BILA